MGTDEDLERALLEVANTKALVYAAIARTHDVDRSTLSRRARGVQISRAVSIQNTSRLLSDAQEEVILQKMETLSNKGIYLAPRTIRNTVEAIIDHIIDKN
jgi:transposase-like protein